MNLSEPPLLSTDEDSPIRKIEFVDENWALVTVRSVDGSDIQYQVRRHSIADQFALNS
jgi:hypothetical protein